jgi:hypothetical protein
VLYCARKYPPSVTGDGVHTVRELLAAHNDALRARGLSPASLPNAIHRSTPYRQRANGGRFPGG